MTHKIKLLRGGTVILPITLVVIMYVREVSVGKHNNIGNIIFFTDLKIALIAKKPNHAKTEDSLVLYLRERV